MRNSRTSVSTGARPIGSHASRTPVTSESTSWFPVEQAPNQRADRVECDELGAFGIDEGCPAVQRLGENTVSLAVNRHRWALPDVRDHEGVRKLAPTRRHDPVPSAFGDFGELRGGVLTVEAG